VVALAATMAGARSIAAQDWPVRPITMVVSFAAGSADDLLARILAPRLSELLGQPVIIENMGGAGGMTAVSRVVKAAPDGYQFVLGGTGTFAANQTLYKSPLYNAATDFTPVLLIGEQPILLMTRQDFPASNLAEFIAYTRANQAKLQFGSGGAGSATHLACLLLNSTIGAGVTHVPYRAAALGLQDMMAGRIDYVCPIASTAIPHIDGGKLKAIAILTRNRSPLLPNLMSAHEQGMTDFDAFFWSAFFMPKGTPAAIVQKLRKATLEAMETPVVQARLKEMAVSLVAPERRSSEYLQKFVESEIKKWAGPIKASGVSMD
jgi:tripartite-type tricarboxylate transporter receptor subunit TctC